MSKLDPKPKGSLASWLQALQNDPTLIDRATWRRLATKSTRSNSANARTFHQIRMCASQVTPGPHQQKAPRSDEPAAGEEARLLREGKEARA
jgi:hypothetical protein